MSREIIWIVGCGAFGLRAYQRLSARKRERSFLLIDPDIQKLKETGGPEESIKLADGVAYLREALHPEAAVDWIVPALPLHLAAEWCLSKSEPQLLSRLCIPPEVEHLVPNPMQGLNTDLYVSLADFFCPDDCPEPRTCCSVTQKPRKEDLFQLLARIRLAGFSSVVLRSHQLAPGVGGYRPDQLFELFSLLKSTSGNLLISTACRCHGVMTALGQSGDQIRLEQGLAPGRVIHSSERPFFLKKKGPF